MTRSIHQAELLAQDEIVASPQPRACNDRSFEMPSAIYGMMAALFFGFMAVMAVGFSHPEMVVPMGINFAFLTAFFAVPAVVVNASVDGRRALLWSEFMRKGIETATGRSSGGEAAILVLLLPFLVFCWAVAIVVIAALI